MFKRPRLVVGLCTALVEAGEARLIYLVLFSWTFFRLGAIQLTGRIRWAELFAVRESRERDGGVAGLH